MSQAQDPNIIGFECRFAVHCGQPSSNDPDLHFVKEIVHYKDGHTEPRTRFIRNFKRPFYITKKGRQNHQSKKEWEDLSNVDKFMSTQSDLSRNIARALGIFGKTDPRQLLRSPYVYGADILSTALIKRACKERYPDLNSMFSVAVFDTETDMLYGTKQIIMATMSYKERVYTAVQKSYLVGMSDVQARAHEAMMKYLGDYVKKRNITWVMEVVETEIDVIKQCFNRAHQWKPDFVAIWNIDFDVPKMLEACERAGVDPAHIFSDPSVPPEYRFFRYKQGPKQKKMASGKMSPIKPADQWHTVYTPASFYFIDAMCVYRKIRVAKGEEQSYSLDFILDKVLGIRKLKFKEAEGYTKAEWHIFMQQNYKFEYIIYNVFDCISMEELDEKTLDLAVGMPSQCEVSDFESFKSQPRRVVNDLDGYVQTLGRVMGTTSDQMKEDFDDLTVSAKEWIVALPAELVEDNGVCMFEDIPGLKSNLRMYVGDLDVSAAYPSNGIVFNMSKETTKKELCKIEGIPEWLQREQTINLSGGATNAVEFCTSLGILPTLEEMLHAFQQELSQSN